MSMRHRWTAFKKALHRIEHKALARVALVGHLAYYGLVSIEAHGNYRYAAGAVGLLLVFEALTGSHGEPPA